MTKVIKTIFIKWYHSSFVIFLLCIKLQSRIQLVAQIKSKDKNIQRVKMMQLNWYRSHIKLIDIVKKIENKIKRSRKIIWISSFEYCHLKVWGFFIGFLQCRLDNISYVSKWCLLLPLEVFVIIKRTLLYRFNSHFRNDTSVIHLFTITFFILNMIIHSSYSWKMFLFNVEKIGVLCRCNDLHIAPKFFFAQC